MGLTGYIYAGAAAAILALAGALWWQTGRVSDLRDQNAVLRASVMALETERDLAKEARAVADARRKASEAKAAQYDRLREGLLSDDVDQVDLPPWFVDYLARLFRQHDDETGQPASSE